MSEEKVEAIAVNYEFWPKSTPTVNKQDQLKTLQQIDFSQTLTGCFFCAVSPEFSHLASPTPLSKADVKLQALNKRLLLPAAASK